MLMTLGSGETVLTNASSSTWKNTSVGIGVLQAAALASSSASQFFVSLDVLYCESFKIILYFSDEAQISLEGGFPGNVLFFYLSGNHFRISAEDAFLNPDGS
jgi:hypothetical protein